jgi:hypothetical protein
MILSRSWRWLATVRFGPALLFTLVATLSPAYAQSPGGQIVDRADLLRTQPTLRLDPYAPVTGPDATHADASPNDPDLGEQAILKRQEHYRAFNVSVSSPFFYTSNVALVRSGEEDDVIFGPEIGLSYTPRLTRTLFANFSIEQQQFFYSRFGELDFGSFDARAGLTYHLPQLRNLTLRGEYNYNRLTSDGFDDFFSDHAILLNAELPFRIGRAQQVSVGTSAEFVIESDPEGPGRHDFDGYVGYSVALTRALTLNAVGRIAVREYREGDRTDVSEVLALSATYRFNKWLSASATSTLAWNQSDEEVFEYDVANVGGALGFSYRF